MLIAQAYITCVRRCDAVIHTGKMADQTSCLRRERKKGDKCEPYARHNNCKLIKRETHRTDICSIVGISVAYG